VSFVFFCFFFFKNCWKWTFVYWFFSLFIFFPPQNPVKTLGSSFARYMYGLVTRNKHFLGLMQTSWIQASRQVTRQLAWDPTCLPLSLSFPIKNKKNLQVLKSIWQYDLFLENYQAFKRLKLFEAKASVVIKHVSSVIMVNYKLCNQYTKLSFCNSITLLVQWGEITNYWLPLLAFKHSYFYSYFIVKFKWVLSWNTNAHSNQNIDLVYTWNKG